MKITKKHGYFWIATGEGAKLTEGYRYGELVATRLLKGKEYGREHGWGEPNCKWTITHFRTGWGVDYESNLQNVREIIRRLNAASIPWQFVTPENSQQYREAYRKAVRGY